MTFMFYTTGSVITMQCLDRWMMGVFCCSAFTARGSIRSEDGQGNARLGLYLQVCQSTNVGCNLVRVQDFPLWRTDKRTDPRRVLISTGLEWTRYSAFRKCKGTAGIQLTFSSSPSCSCSRRAISVWASLKTTGQNAR